jgi:hypothetical protein
MDTLRAKIAECCKKYSIGCGITVSAGLVGLDGIQVYMLSDDAKIAGDRQGEAIAAASENGPVSWKIGLPEQSDNILGHELGHFGGYKNRQNPAIDAHLDADGVIQYEFDVFHSNDHKAIMAPNDGGSEVDCHWCQAIAKTAK